MPCLNEEDAAGRVKPLCSKPYQWTDAVSESMEAATISSLSGESDGERTSVGEGGVNGREKQWAGGFRKVPRHLSPLGHRGTST